MTASNRNQVSITPRSLGAQIAEIRRRVAQRGGTRFIERGALKLTVPRSVGTGELVS